MDSADITSGCFGIKKLFRRLFFSNTKNSQLHGWVIYSGNDFGTNIHKCIIIDLSQIS